jgi:hypothetical protein
MVPFYIYYSMFGFQRVGDFIWAAGDSQARGFLVGGTAGRTTLAGEGLQHQDGHSQLVATTVPNCVAYDPTFAYELAVIVQDGMRRMYQDQENVFYYITCMNENYAHPAMPAGVAQGILNGMYLLQIGGRGKVRVTLFGSGTILREVLAAAELLERDYGVPADVYSVTSFSELRRNALEIERWNMLHPGERAEEPTSSRRSRPRGPVHRRHRLHEDRARIRSGSGCRGVMPCSARTASGAAIRAPSCAASSRSTATMWWSRRSRRWPTTARSKTDGRPGDADLRHRPGKTQSPVGLGERCGNPSKYWFPTSAVSRTSASSTSWSGRPADRKGNPADHHRNGKGRHGRAGAGRRTDCAGQAQARRQGLAKAR